jgi:hypothetical protein
MATNRDAAPPQRPNRGLEAELRLRGQLLRLFTQAEFEGLGACRVTFEAHPGKEDEARQWIRGKTIHNARPVDWSPEDPEAETFYR